MATGMRLMTRVPGIGLRVAGALLLGAALMVPAAARAYYAGGGKKAENDCLIGYDFVDPGQVTDAGTKKQAVVCVDGNRGIATSFVTSLAAMGIPVVDPGPLSADSYPGCEGRFDPLP